MSRGLWAEEWVEHRCRRLGIQGLAFIRRVTPPAKLVSGPRGPRAFFQAAGLPDFVGFLRGGRGVLFDVKSTYGKSWAWPEGKNRRTKERQIQDLEEAGDRFGVLSGLLIGFSSSSGEYPVWAWVPWPLLRRVASGSWTPHALIALRDSGTMVWQDRPGEEDFVMVAKMLEGDERAGAR